MKKIAIVLLVLLFNSTFIKAGEIVVEGNFMGKNIFVTNPYASSNNVGFCVTEVFVNGKLTTDEIQQSSFEIDLISLQLVVGQKVTIKIKHRDGCTPKIVNPEDLKPRATFEIVAGSMKVTKDGLFLWSTKNETGKLDFIVEQYRWNKWVTVGKVEGRGTAGPNTYNVKYEPFSGENRIRVKQVDVTGSKVSSPYKYRSMSPVVTFTQGKDQNITFSADTKWEVYDMFGNIAKRGNGTEIDVSDLKKGIYQMNFDNKSGEKFTKK
ncbi:MAG: T9SS type A sorting domain-containing protein [Bacteroidia bacterium]|nr:T9SS type A sorting domain-containing protein [Bacteroidia bacterium]